MHSCVLKVLPNALSVHSSRLKALPNDGSVHLKVDGSVHSTVRRQSRDKLPRAAARKLQKYRDCRLGTAEIYFLEGFLHRNYRSMHSSQ